MMRRYSATVVLWCAACCLLVERAGADTVLVPPPPYLPLTAPKGPPVSAPGRVALAAPALVTKGVKLWADGQEKHRWDAAVAEGSRVARAAGQRGFLVKVRYVQSQTFDGKFIRTPVGDGAVFVGAGPDADAVCLALSCQLTMDSAGELNGIRTIAPDSAYHFLAESSDKAGRPVTTVSTYRIEDLHKRSETVTLSMEANKSYLYAMNGQVVDGLANALKRDAQSQADRAEIKALLDARDSAKSEIARIEKELDVELTRQEERAQTAKMLSNLAGIVSGGSALAARTEDPNAAAASDSKIASMQADRTAAMQRYEATGKRILERGVSTGRMKQVALPRVPPGPIAVPRADRQGKVAVPGLR